MDIDNKNEALRELFNILANGSSSDIKDAKKEIEKLQHWNRRHTAKDDALVLDIIKDFDRIADAEHQAAVISSVNLFFLRLIDTHFDELALFVLKTMVSRDGRVREATRHAASWLRFKHTHASMALDPIFAPKKISDEKIHEAKEDVKTYERFLESLEDLMKTHSPAVKPIYIGKQAPSIYKSLILFWYDMSIGTSRDLEHREQLMDPMSEEYIPLLGKDDDEEEIDAEEIEENIWADKGDGDERAGAAWLARLEALAEKRFAYELGRLKFTPEEALNILAAVRLHKQEAGQYVLADVMRTGSERGSITQFSDANNLVREMQACANHDLARNKHGAISRLLVEAVVERECSRSGKPDDLAVFIKLIYQSHEAIDIFWEPFEKRKAKDLAHMLAFNEKVSALKEAAEKYADELKAREEERKLERYLGRSVAHHILDWYIQSDPKGFNRIRDPRKVAAYILYIVRDHNAKATDGEVFLTYENKELSAFGGWKSASNFGMVEYNVARPVLAMVGDADLLLIDPTKLVSPYKEKGMGVGKFYNEMDKNNTRAMGGQEPMTIEHIQERRKEIETELADLLRETKSDFTLEDVKDCIFHEKSSNDMIKIVAMFDRGGDVFELDNILELVNDAWNYFPHEVLGGISPVEKLQER